MFSKDFEQMRVDLVLCRSLLSSNSIFHLLSALAKDDPPEHHMKIVVQRLPDRSSPARVEQLRQLELAIDSDAFSDWRKDFHALQEVKLALVAVFQYVTVHQHVR